MKKQICRGIKKGGKSTSEYKGREVGLFVIARNVFGLPNTDLISRLVREKISLRPF